MPAASTKVEPADLAHMAIADPLRIPRERYFDRAFFEAEKRDLWFKTWQMACRLQEIPEAHDYVEYEICGQSIVIVRQEDGSVRAYHNACRHRGTALVRGAGNLRDGRLVCPFHGWSWRADGQPASFYGAAGFAPECMRPSDIRLQECKLEVWGGCAWVNLDPSAGPLMEALQPAAGMLDEIGIENLQVKWWKETVLRVNWKIALEAFLEGWHVMQTHPQMTFGMYENFPPDAAEYHVYPNGHSSFNAIVTTKLTSLDALLASSRVLGEGQDAMILERDMVIFEGLRHKLSPEDDVRAEVVKALQDYNRGAGIPMREGAEHRPIYWAGEVFVFPNFVILPYFGNALCYRVRPHDDDPEQCRFEVWSLTTYPASRPVERARSLGRFPIDDVENWGLIPRQDFGNMERQQLGIHSLSYQSHRLATVWENAIANLHLELDRRLQIVTGVSPKDSPQ